MTIDQGREGWRANRALVFFCWLARRCKFEKPIGKQKTTEGIIASKTLVMQVFDPFALDFREAQAHRQLWVSLGWARRYCRYSERAPCFISAT